MDRLPDVTVLYHAGYCEVKRPDLEMCAKNKDFGQGFYLTTSKEQARRFVKTAVKKAAFSGMIDRQQKFGIISSFVFAASTDIKFFYYPEADDEWLHCVVWHRKGDVFLDLAEKLNGYDIISGKIANDRTNATIAAYMAGAYGEIGSAPADGICISLLLPERLENQFCFRTQKALDCLSFAESERVWI